MVCPVGRVQARAQPLTVAVPVLVTVMLAVRPLFQALTTAVARQAAPPGGGVLGAGVVGSGVVGSGVGLDGGVVSPNWVKNCHTSAETQDVEALRSTGSGTWSPSCAAHWTGYPARHPEYAVVM